MDQKGGMRVLRDRGGEMGAVPERISYEAENIAIILTRQLRGDSLGRIGELF